MPAGSLWMKYTCEVPEKGSYNVEKDQLMHGILDKVRYSLGRKKVRSSSTFD